MNLKYSFPYKKGVGEEIIICSSARPTEKEKGPRN